MQPRPCGLPQDKVGREPGSTQLPAPETLGFEGIIAVLFSPVRPEDREGTFPPCPCHEETSPLGSRDSLPLERHTSPWVGGMGSRGNRRNQSLNVQGKEQQEVLSRAALQWGPELGRQCRRHKLAA